MAVEQHCFLVSQRLMPPHFTHLDYGGLYIHRYYVDSSAHHQVRSCVPMLHNKWFSLMASQL